MSLFEFNPFQQHFDVIEKWLPTIPINYFDFPASATAFCLSLSNSEPLFIGNSLFRKAGKICKLVSFKGEYLPEEDIYKLQSMGYTVKSLPFGFKTPIRDAIKDKYEFYATLPYNFTERIAFHSRGNRGRLRRDYRQGAERYEVVEQVGKVEFLHLFEEWLRDAKDRHFMVRKGHHLAYIHMYFNKVGNIKVLGFRRKVDGLLCGVMGFEIVGNQAQMTLGKHRLGDNCLSTFYYVKTLEFISNMGISRVLCGSSGEEFKSRIGLEKIRSWKPKI